MKVLVIGDLHCRSIWKDIVAKEGNSCDKIIFLGDYTCPREIKFDDPTDACGFLYEVLDYKDKNPNKVVLLRGNHDMASLGYYWARCWPQDHPKVQEYWQTNDVKNWFLSNTEWIYQIPDTNIICSHAGISQEFLDSCFQHLKFTADVAIPENSDNQWVIDHINKLEPSELFGFTPCKFSDYNGESSTQPCIWIRPYTLMYYGIEGLIQVVGHTPVDHICNLKEEIKKQKDSFDNPNVVNEYKDVWCCDNLMNEEYLIIEDGEFKSYKL